MLDFKNENELFWLSRIQRPMKPTRKLESFTINSYYVWWSFFNMLFCNLIFGIVALSFSYKAKKSILEENFNQFKTYKNRSDIFNIIATLLGVGCWIIIIFFLITKKLNFIL